MIGKSRLACQAKCPIEFQPESAVEHRAEGPNDNVRLVRLTNGGNDLEKLRQTKQGKAAGVDWNYDRVCHSQGIGAWREVCR